MESSYIFKGVVLYRVYIGYCFLLFSLSCGMVCIGEEMQSFGNTAHFWIPGLKLEISQWSVIY